MQGQTSSQVNLRPKFHLHNSKLQVYAENAIKRSNVKGFVNQNLRTSERITMQNNENKNLSHHLLHLKNSCCDLKKDIYNKENTTIKLKDETNFTQEKVRQLQSQRQKLQERIANLTKDVEIVSTKKQSTSHTFKTYQNILWRMKKDQITNQIRKNNLHKQIVNLQKELKLIDNKLYSMKEYEELSYKGLRQAEFQIQKENIQRQKKVNEMNSVLHQKKISQAKKQERHMQTKSIQEMAAGDLQDVELIRMKKFFEVQLFLRILLRDKMERLKNYYEPYEIAFLKIKAQTSAKDASALKTQFFNFETQFQEKTAWIKHLEDQMASLEAEKKELQEDLTKQRQIELDILDEYESKKPENESDERQNHRVQRQQINQRSLDAELILMRLKQWTSLQSKRISSENSSQSEINSLPENLNNICDYLIELKNKE